MDEISYPQTKKKDGGAEEDGKGSDSFRSQKNETESASVD